jgi:nicotinamidase-related amidase
MRERKEGSTVQGGRRTFLRLLTGAGVAGGLWLAPKPAAAQTKPGEEGGTRVSTAFKYRRLSKDDAAVLLVDHQSGLISLVQDYSPGEFQNNVLALADIAKYYKLPTILTTSFEDGPNGPMVPELKAMFPDAPYIPRPGQINAWDNEDFVKAVKATGRNQLIIAGVVTDVCVAFPTLSALEAGYEVFAVIDASGTFNTAVREAAWTRMASAGAQLVNWFSVACELHRDWRNDVEGLGNILSNHIPAYRNLITSYVARKK